MNKYHTSGGQTRPPLARGDGGRAGGLAIGVENPVPLTAGLPDEIRHIPFHRVSVDRLTILGDISSQARAGAFDLWKCHPDLLQKTFAKYPYRYQFKTVSGALIQEADPSAEIPLLRVEINPNNYQKPPDCLLKILGMMKNVRLSRLDIAIDYPGNLGRYTFTTDTGKKGCYFTSKSGLVETVYLGSSTSPMKYRIYDKAKEQKIKDATWWRIEAQMNLRPSDNWREKMPFQDLHIGMVNENINVIDRAVMRELAIFPESWAELTDYQRRKYKRMMKQEEVLTSMRPHPLEIYEKEKWRVDACLNQYLYGMEREEKCVNL